jgi:hypothetical protein
MLTAPQQLMIPTSKQDQIRLISLNSSTLRCKISEKQAKNKEKDHISFYLDRL